MRKLTAKQELKKFIESFTISAAKEAADLLSKRMDIGITNYYSDYNPIYYNSGSPYYGMRVFNFRDKSYKKYTTKRMNKDGIVKAGLRFLPDNSYVYKFKGIPIRRILNKSLEGYHGYERLTGFVDKEIIDGKTVIKRDTRVWRPIITASPFDYTVKYLNGKEIENKIYRAGLQKAKSIEYKVIDSILDDIVKSISLR